jgi:hypothetical protein
MRPCACTLKIFEELLKELTNGDELLSKVLDVELCPFPVSLFIKCFCIRILHASDIWTIDL